VQRFNSVLLHDGIVELDDYWPDRQSRVHCQTICISFGNFGNLFLVRKKRGIMLYSRFGTDQASNKLDLLHIGIYRVVQKLHTVRTP